MSYWPLLAVCGLLDVSIYEMDLLGHYSNHELQGSLSCLAKKLADVRASGEARRRPMAYRQRPRRPGWVLKAIVQVLGDQVEPMRAKDIHAAVAALVGEPVSWGSVKCALAANVSGLLGAPGSGGAGALRAGRDAARSSIVWNLKAPPLASRLATLTV
jgi:hypothetical protein